MTAPRSLQVQPDVTSYYHCMTRCVRRAFLMGSDASTGQRFDHRKRWVVEELARLERVFAVDVCAYAVMSNHIHLVLRLDGEAGRRWSEEELVARARTLFPGAVRLAEDAGVLAARLPEYRERLTSLSWFMRCLNERIARRANREDGCSGRFWEGRFKCRALLDHGALLTCMTYVDLNPVHAGIARSLADSDFTSIQLRLAQHGRALHHGGAAAASPGEERVSCGDVGRHHTPALVPFFDEASSPSHPDGGVESALPFERAAYVELVRFTGHAIRSDKPGSLSSTAAATVRAKGLSPERWGDALRDIATLRFAAIGERHLIHAFAHRCGRRRTSNAAWGGRAYEAQHALGTTSTSTVGAGYACAA